MNYRQIRSVEHRTTCDHCKKNLGENFCRIDDKIFCDVKCAKLSGMFSDSDFQRSHLINRRQPS